MKKCSKCGTENSKDAVFCENCGSLLNENKKEENISISEGNIESVNRRSKKAPGNKKILAMMVAIIVIIMAIVGVVYLKNGKNNTQTAENRNEVTLKKSSSSSRKSSVSKEESSSRKKSEQISSSSSTIDESNKLTVTGLTNKQNAASILIYGAIKYNGNFKGTYDMALKNSILTVDVVSTDGNDTKPDETPIFYSLAPGEIDNNCGYKLGRNREVYFYEQSDKTIDFFRIGSTTQDEIINYMNTNNLVNKVNELANETTVYGE